MQNIYRTCSSCDGIGNHGTGKRGNLITCSVCNGSKRELVPEDEHVESLKSIYPNIDDDTASLLISYYDDMKAIETMFNQSENSVLVFYANRDGETVGVEMVIPDMLAIDNCLSDIDDYSGNWGDYHTVTAIIYKQTSFEYGSNDTYGSDKLETLLPRSIDFGSVKQELIKSLEDTKTNKIYDELYAKIEALVNRIL